MPRLPQPAISTANGHAFGLPADPPAPALLHRLNSGARLRVRDAVSACSGTISRGGVRFTASAREVRAVLERLYSLRAITVD